MGTSQVINRWLNKVYKTVAILLVIFAVLISALRLFLPYAHHYKQNVQNFINRSNESQIIIGELGMGWEKLGPTLVVKRVQLLQTKSTDIYIDQIDVHLDFWQSLLTLSVITQNVTLEGAEVLVKTTDMSAELDENEKTLTERISDIFLDHISRFTLLNSKVIFETDNIEKTLLINQLNWLNVGNRHRAKGYVVVDGLTTNNIKVLLDVKGDSLANFDGQAYFQANQLNITPWLDTVLAINNEDTHSSINFDGWLTIKKDLPLQLQIALGQNEISWQHQQKNKFFSVNHGQIIAQSSRDFKQLSIFTSPLSFVTNSHEWKPTEIQFTKTPNITSAFANYIDIGGVGDVFPLFSSNSEIIEALSEIDPEGSFTNIHFRVLANNESEFYAQVNALNTHQYSSIPGVKNINGEVSFRQNTANANLLASNGELDFAEHFIQPIPYKYFKADVDFTFDDSGWLLSSDNIEVESDELSMSSQLYLSKALESSTKMSLLTNITHLNAKFANHYYPQLIMSSDLVNYLNNALVEGTVNQAQILFNGPLDKFPFNHNEGIFSVNAELSDGVFKFDPSWPAINDFNANLNFTNAGMLITGRSGTLAGVDVKGVTAEIKDLLSERVLRVDAAFNQTSPTLVTKLMNDSPLASSVGSTLNRIKITKPISGDFSLLLPFKDIENTIAKGSVNFKNNTVELSSPNMLFNNVYGQLTYNNQQISAPKIKLNWLDMPLVLSVKADDKAMHYDTEINIQAKWKDGLWNKQLPENIRKYGSGDLMWNGLLSLNMFHDGEFSYDLGIKSDLKPINLKLPSPYNKSANTVKQLSASVSGQKNSSVINVALGQDLTFYGELDHNRVVFDKAHLLLGKDDMLSPTKGFHITTNLDVANLNEWHPFIDDIVKSTDTNKTASTELNKESTQPILEKPNRIRGEIKSVMFDEYTISDVLYSLESLDKGLLLDINAKEARAQAMFNNNWLSEGVNVKADFINLAKTTLEPPDNDIAPPLNANLSIAQALIKSDRVNQQLYENIPPISLLCSSCIIDNIDFGTVELDISRNDLKQVELKRFVAARDKSSIYIKGLWAKKGTQNITSFYGDLNIDDLEQETKKLGYAATIKDSGLKSEFSLNWKGSPIEFSLKKLNGQFNAILDDGYLAEVPDQARVFSVLSLQSLVRKLRFDFRDIFSDGMFYSEIKGDYQLENGVMYTDNMFMKGAAGDLEVKGNTDLGKELLDIRMSYKPNVTSSLPALAWIATLNPVAFLAGIALEEVITSKVYYEMNFELTGSMSEPVFKDVNRKTRNISVGKTTPPKVVDQVIESDSIDKSINENNTSNLEKQRIKKMRIDG